jgi:SNF2 family DNA or RNA helicase
MVISLRAGGTGLTLTRASHVCHFDRWWNPAVEDQASDRAHRIGQRRTVVVHPMVCRGTLEERVDRMLADKAELAALAVRSGEAFLTELDDEQLEALVRLTDALEPEEVA